MTSTANQAMDTTPSTVAKTTPCRSVSSPVTSGRCFVRFISRSMSRSRYMLNALADPAANAPPTRVRSVSQVPGQPSAATIIVGTVVMSSSSMIRGLVSAR